MWWVTSCFSSVMPSARRTTEARPSAPTTRRHASSTVSSPRVYRTDGDAPSVTSTSRTPRTTVAPASAARPISSAHASGCRRFSEPGMSGIIEPTGIAAATASSGAKPSA